MRKIALMLIFSLLLCGCTAGSEDYLAYTNGAFRATIEGTSGEFSFAAEIIAGPAKSPEEGGNSAREISMRFIRPASMEDLTISRQNGAVSINSGGLEVDGALAYGWLSLALLLCPECDVGKVKLVGEGNERLGAVEILIPDGTGVIYVDTDTGFPVRVTYDRDGVITDVRVISFDNTKS